MELSNLQNVQRTDIYDLPITSLKKTKEGWLMGEVIATHTGIFPYQLSDGSVRKELRTDEDVFNIDSLESLKNKPMTNNHPNRLLDANTASSYTVGHMGSTVRVEKPYIIVDLMVFDAATIKAIEKGKRALSMGYTCDLVQDSDDADYRQTNIVYNHISLVEKGRAKNAGLRLDSLENVQVHCTDLYINNDEEKSMADNDLLRTYHLDNVEVQAEQRFIDAFSNLKSKFDALEVNEKNLQKEKSTIEADRDANKLKLDSAIVELEKVKKDFDEFKKTATSRESVMARLELEKLATDRKITFKADESDLDIKKKIIVSKFDKISLDGKDETYIDGLYTATMEIFKADSQDDKSAIFRKIEQVKPNLDAGFADREAKHKLAIANMNAHKEVK